MGRNNSPSRKELQKAVEKDDICKYGDLYREESLKQDFSIKSHYIKIQLEMA